MDLSGARSANRRIGVLTSHRNTSLGFRLARTLIKERDPFQLDFTSYILYLAARIFVIQTEIKYERKILNEQKESGRGIMIFVSLGTGTIRQDSNCRFDAVI